MPPWRENPADVRPMLASLADPPVSQHGLVYEPKYDGIRALVDLRPPSGRKAVPHVAIYSRNGNDKTKQFPEIAAMLAALGRKLKGPVLLDGEIVATGKDATPLGFQHIQGRIHLSGASEIQRALKQQPAALVVFDILRDGPRDVRGCTMAERRLILQARVRPTSAQRRIVRLSEIAMDDGRPLLARARKEGWEGLIVKDGTSVYHSGRRTPAGRLDHGGRWRDEADWPLPETRFTPYYLHEDGTLSPDAPALESASLAYDYDPSQPVPTIGGPISSGAPVMAGDPPTPFDGPAPK